MAALTLRLSLGSDSGEVELTFVSESFGEGSVTL